MDKSDLKLSDSIAISIRSSIDLQSGEPCEIIVRDNGCDLGIEGREIYGRIYIHHMNPIAVKDLTDRTDLLLNPEYLITTTFNTHQAIHYSDEGILIPDPIERKPNDTCPWKR